MVDVFPDIIEKYRTEGELWSWHAHKSEVKMRLWDGSFVKWKLERFIVGRKAEYFVRSESGTGFKIGIHNDQTICKFSLFW